MKHFKFIGGNELSEKQLDDIANLLLDTGYYEYSSLQNKLNLPTKEFHKVQTLKPHADYTHVLINTDNNEVVGFFIVWTKQQIAEVENKTPDWHRDDPELKESLQKLMHYYVNETSDKDLVSYGIAINSKYRGQGLFKILNAERAKLAQQEGCTKIAFVVWESNPAVQTFQHCGATINGEIDLTNTAFKDTLLKCSFDLNDLSCPTTHPAL